MPHDSNPDIRRSSIPLGALEVGSRLVLHTHGPVPYRFTVTERAESSSRSVAIGELRGGLYRSPRRAALVGPERLDGERIALALGDRAVFLVDPVASDEPECADRIVTSAITRLVLEDVVSPAA